jgi:putative transcriptional regulator
MKQINRLKILLVENNKSGKWLGEQLGKDPATISRWCNNHAQPSVETFSRIAEVLEVDIKDLFHSTRRMNQKN